MKKNEANKSYNVHAKDLLEQFRILYGKAKDEYQTKEEKKKFMGDNTKSKVQKTLNINLFLKLGNPMD